MPQSEPSLNSRIELDQMEAGSTKEPSSRRSRPIVQEQSPSLPKIEPVLCETSVGSDETERTVGIFMLLSTLPGIILLVSGHVAVGLFSIVIPVYFGVGLLRGDDFVRQWVFAGCLAQLILGPISALVSMDSILFVVGGLLQSGGLLALVSGKAFSKHMYHLLLSALAIGTLIGTIGSFWH